MKASAIFLCGVVLLLGGGAVFARPANQSSQQTGVVPAVSEGPTYFRDVLPILMGKCGRCHGGQSTFIRNWLDYKTAFGDRQEMKRRVWHSWKGSYFKQPMPIQNSPEAQVITEEERLIIKQWVENGAPRGVLPVYNGSEKGGSLEVGKRLFSTICAACHQPTGLGLPNQFPPLAGSDLLNGDKHRAIKIVVNGLQGEVVVNGRKFNNTMPQLPLSDQEIASVLTFVYHSFGNSGKDVTPEEVGSVRTEKADPNSAGQISGAKPPQTSSPYE